MMDEPRGRVTVGKAIAAEVGYRRTVLELGGNDPLSVLNDLDDAAPPSWP